MKKTGILAIVCVMVAVNVASADMVRGIDVDFVTIGNAGNAGDTRAGGYANPYGCGAVSYNYRIGKYKVTNAQWDAFVAIAGAPTGNGSGYSHSAEYGGAQQPTNCVSWYEATQFCNYLTSGDKSKGVYQFSGDNANPGSFIGIDRAVAKATYGTIYFLPTEDEWYKAAYYTGGYSPRYSLYSNGTDIAPVVGVGANYGCSPSCFPWNVGSGVQEQNGTFDMMGCVWERIETLIGSGRGIRGGSYTCVNTYLMSSCRYSGGQYPYEEWGDCGFRVASTIPEPSTPPIADAGPDQTVTDPDDTGSKQVTLDGSASSDSDGTIASWVWTDSLGASIPDGETTTVALSVGTHTITLRVTDNDGLTGTDTVTITVEPYPNQPPVADADGPYTIFVGSTLTLDASGSTDHANDIVSYLWDLNDDGVFETDAGDEATFSVDYALLQSIGLLVDNTYTIRAKVTDSVGQSNVASSTLTILPIPALPVVVDIKPGSCPNPLNVKSSGVLPVAILGAAGFDVFSIDPTSIRLAGVRPLRSSYEDVAVPVSDANDCACTEHGPDGFLDLTLKFKTQEIVTAIGDVNDGQVLALQLTGVLFDERPIEGSDCVLIGGRHKSFNKADFNRDGKVDWADYAAFSENWMQSTIVEE